MPPAGRGTIPSGVDRTRLPEDRTIKNRTAERSARARARARSNRRCRPWSAMSGLAAPRIDQLGGGIARHELQAKTENYISSFAEDAEKQGEELMSKRKAAYAEVVNTCACAAGAERAVGLGHRRGAELWLAQTRLLPPSPHHFALLRLRPQHLLLRVRMVRQDSSGVVPPGPQESQAARRPLTTNSLLQGRLLPLRPPIPQRDATRVDQAARVPPRAAPASLSSGQGEALSQTPSCSPSLPPRL